MGWTCIHTDGIWRIYTRGGFSGVLVKHGDDEFNIPRGVLLRLAAEEIQSNKIARLEDQSNDDILQEAGLRSDR